MNINITGGGAKKKRSSFSLKRDRVLRSKSLKELRGGSQVKKVIKHLLNSNLHFLKHIF